MSIQLQGNGGVVIDADGTNFRALRTCNKPLDHGALGHYSYAGLTGVLGAALGANSEIFQFKWTSSAAVAVINRVEISACVSTTFFAAGVPVQIDLVRSTGWTVAGTGGTGITAAALMRKRNNMGNSLLTANDMRIATTAALGVGTKTLDTHSMAAIAAPGPITASLNGQIIAPGTVLFQSDVADAEYPLVINTNEGFSVRSVAVPITGTWTAAIRVDWTEVAAY